MKIIPEPAGMLGHDVMLGAEERGATKSNGYGQCGGTSTTPIQSPAGCGSIVPTRLVNCAA